jgi:glycolate oxidase FAD binding subunit
MNLETVVLTPGSAAEVAAALHHASDARQSLVIRGAGTKQGWGRPSAKIDAILDMRRLNRILAHEHGDMTATIEAGASLRDVNEALAVHRQTLPLDPPFADRATIGGLLASNDSGPLRHRYGTPRDLVIGVQLATTDGVLSNAGGRVVKNVAGYDLSKLVTGSFGSLAAIVSATFKLSPLPSTSRTMRIDLRDGAALSDLVGTVMSSQLEPMAFDVAAAGVTALAPTVLLRFGSLPEVVDAQIADATAALTAFATSVDIVEGAAEGALWDAHGAAVWDAPGAVVRASWLPANLASGLREIASPGLSLAGRAGVGAGHVRIEGDTTTQAAAIARLRASSSFGNIVVVRASDELKARVDVWGSQGGRQVLFDSLKRAFDPHGVLNAGRGPL